MKSSRKSNLSSFSGLSASYSEWNKSRRRGESQSSRKGTNIITGIVFMLVCLQVYYLAQDKGWGEIAYYASKGLFLLLAVLIHFFAIKYILIEQKVAELRVAPMMPSYLYKEHITKTTEKALNQLQKDKRFIALQRKSRKGSQHHRASRSDEQFFLQLDEMEDEFGFKDK